MRFLQQSEIRNMTLECTRVGGINLSQGVCDTPVPELVRRAAQTAIDEGVNTYTRYDGLAEILDVAGRLLRSEPANLQAGANSWSWDGRDRSGREVPSGNYLVRLTHPEATAALRVQRLNQ